MKDKTQPLWTKQGKEIEGTFEHIEGKCTLVAYDPEMHECERVGDTDIYWNNQKTAIVPAVGELPASPKFMDEDGLFYYIEDLLIGDTFETAKPVLDYSGTDRDLLLMSADTGVILEHAAETTLSIKWWAVDEQPLSDYESGMLRQVGLRKAYEGALDDLKGELSYELPRVTLDAVRTGQSPRIFEGHWKLETK